VIFFLSAPSHAIVFFLGVFLLCFFFWVLFTMKHYGHFLPCCCLLLGVPRNANAYFWALLVMLVLASRCSLACVFFWCSSPCYCLLLIIPFRDVGFGHSLMCCCLLLGVLCHAIISRPPHRAITSGLPYCVVVVACTRWSCFSRFQGNQFSFPIQLVFFFIFCFVCVVFV